MLKKMFAFLSALTVLTALFGLAYYFFKLNPEYCPFSWAREDELE